MAARREKEKVQFNIRVDSEVLARFREYCDRHGLDPTLQVTAFMRRVVETDLDFQEKLWEALRAHA